MILSPLFFPSVALRHARFCLLLCQLGSQPCHLLPGFATIRDIWHIHLLL
jgi:hypothetical protein